MRNFETLLIENENQICTVWLNRPESKNALTETMISELTDFFREASDDDDIRVIVLRGKGESFCTDFDPSYIKAIVKNDYEKNYIDGLQLANCYNTIYTCKKPTIAVVHGEVIGSALGMVAACDITICHERAIVAVSLINHGMIPAASAIFIIKRIGEAAARELMLTGRKIDGQEAERIGLFNKTLASKRVEKYVKSIIDELLESSPFVAAQCKEMIYNLTNKSRLEDAIDYAAKMIALVRDSDEGKEGLQSRISKRVPRWVKKTTTK